MSAFDLILFSTDPARIRAAVAGGVSSVIVDWERFGKHERQAGADTLISVDTVEDLTRARSATAARVLCRINALGPHTPEDVEAALAGGADELMLPMVRSPREVLRLLELVDGRCDVGILVETADAVAAARALAQLPLARVYVGLNDLAIERRTGLFAPLADGTMDRLREAFDVPFGFGGLTLPDRGEPIPCALLIAEMARLRCAFSFLRRSFNADAADPLRDVPRIHAALATAFARDGAAVARDHAALLALLRTPLSFDSVGAELFQ